MKANFSPSVQRELEKIHRLNKKLSKRIEKQVALFEENPKHPSLRTHKLISNTENLWSISINMSIRMVYIHLEDDKALFIKIGTHDQVYSK